MQLPTPHSQLPCRPPPPPGPPPNTHTHIGQPPQPVLHLLLKPCPCPCRANLAAGTGTKTHTCFAHASAPPCPPSSQQFIEARLDKQTAELAHGCAAVCLFVNDACDGEVGGQGDCYLLTYSENLQIAALACAQPACAWLPALRGPPGQRTQRGARAAKPLPQLAPPCAPPGQPDPLLSRPHPPLSDLTLPCLLCLAGGGGAGQGGREVHHDALRRLRQGKAARPCCCRLLPAPVQTARH